LDQGHGVGVFGRIKVQPGALSILFQQALTLEAAADASANQLNQLFQFAFVWRLDALKSGWAVVAIYVDAIQEQDVKVYIEVEGRSEALDQRYRTGSANLEIESGLVDQVCRDRPVNDAQHLAHGLGVGGKQVTQGKGKADDPLAKRDIGKYIIREQSSTLGHAARATAGAESALLAGKRNKPLEVAFVAAHPEKAVFEATALQVGLEFPVNMVGQGLTLMGQLVHQGGVVRFDELVEQCLLRLMALVSSFAKAIPALCQHGGSASDLHRAERTRLGQQHEECHVRSVR
jgi:hypothetical protein